ncbi:TonB-dependent receptor [Xinfangfangia sp. D13-10-4-6]|uniref:TonB-dependent receptor n=1 Tax=Pseudogemmobacter hezensis TaxID=2737662 RepID=UPI0015541E02|nr:TonB-dependent receptor [Pseudogemmobacter hezensis]NPD14014.1 TonB-dependent receptor [Pseudogemmobacter hezensis]
MPSTHRGRLARGASLLSIIAAFTAHPAMAQDAADTSSLGTIYLTGEKQQRDLKDTASSVTLITGEELVQEKPGKDDVKTVLQGTPNVIYTDNVSTPVIRGQNAEGPHTGATAFFAGTMPRATINVDGHYLSYNELYFGGSATWDVASIEVFRGPQTTSQGANAIGGAIIVNTNDPTWEPEGAYRLEFGNYNQRRASFAWSGPINDQLAARVALDYSSRDTFIDYISPAFEQNEIGQDFRNLTGRVKFLWQPTDIDGLTVKLTYSRSDVIRPSAEGAAQAPEYSDLNSTTIWMPGWDQITDTAVIDVDYDFGNGIVFTNKFETSSAEVQRRVGRPTMGDANVWRDNYANESKLSFGTPEDVFSGVAGLYIAYADQDEWLNQGGESTFHDQKNQLGLYSELSWRLDDQWTLTGGLRYQRDHLRRTGDVSPLFANSDVDYDQVFEEVLPKLTLSYAATPDWTVGAMVSKGYNPGGISLDFIGTHDWTKYKEETVWNYELFTRANLLDDRLFVSGNLFYMDYSNAQHSVSQMTAAGINQTQTLNAEKAHAYGLEVAMDYRPVDSLQLRASAGYLKTKIDEMTAATQWEGNEFARSPGKTFTLGANWDPTEQLTVGGQLRFIDGYYSNTANTPAFEVDNYTLVDIHASYQLRDNLTVYGYVNNVFDERSPTLLEAARGTIPFTQGSMTSPRMFGIGIRGTF